MDKQDSLVVNAVSMSHTRKNVKISSARSFPLHNNNFFSYFYRSNIFNFLCWPFTVLYKKRCTRRALLTLHEPKKSFTILLHNARIITWLRNVITKRTELRAEFAIKKGSTSCVKCRLSAEKVMFKKNSSVCMCVSVCKFVEWKFPL